MPRLVPSHLHRTVPMPQIAPSDERIGPPVLDFQYVQKPIIRFFMNEDPNVSGLKVVRRKSVAARDAKHEGKVLEAIEQGENISADLIKRDRIRPGRKDTGEPVVNGDVGVVLSGFAAELIADGYQIRNFHVAVDTKPAKKAGGEPRKRYIPTFTFEYGAEPAENADELLALLEGYAQKPATLFVYDNPDNTATFNCTNLGQGRPRGVLGIEEGILTSTPIAQ